MTYPLGNLVSSSIIKKDLPDLIQSTAMLPKSKYLITGSIGQGRPVDIPWICIFDKEISTSAQNGYYIVYLFDSELEGFYLCFGQGWTQYENQLGSKLGKQQIAKNVKIAQQILRGSSGFDKSDIDLLSNGRLAKGYEAGVMLSKYYSMSDLPDDVEFIDDLRSLLGVYQELKGIVGSDIVDICNIIDEDLFQESIQQSSAPKTPKGRLKPKDKKSYGSSGKYLRNASVSFEALENAGFECEYDSNHETFISAKTGHQFVEAHHLVPMEFQKVFEFSIDVPENIISLCPTCHRRFHYADAEKKSEIVRKFYDLRRDALANERGVVLSKEELLAYYQAP